MKIQEFEKRTPDGLKLRGKSWYPDEQPEAIVCAVHGLGDHIGRYEHIASFLNSHQIGFVGADLRGHGLSDGKRGHTPDYDTLLNDVELVINKVSADFPGVPLFLYGQSMGGNIVANYIIRRDKDIVKGAIISSAWFKLAFEPPSFKVKLGQLMAGIYPAFSQNNEIDANDLCSDATVVRAYEEDPLVHSKISAAMFFNVYEAGLWALEQAENVKLPVLVMHGDQDKLTSFEASQEFAKRASDHSTIKIWEGMLHEPHNEPGKDPVLSTIKDWIVKQLQPEEVMA